ncbi:hypothetical protein HH212_26575 (plasmid) [Massilia forsythiae]|uniref:Uncharacterized protein n=1 Tax=Massilia forsythiae TaxID=2728020 RepID=A0A7Z2ZVU4_9BURK|nr:hypothetical protein [Massilia forsythiae]QJE03670.1 hypothetical protein HH212_26575 [Massilia forsythiae]
MRKGQAKAIIKAYSLPPTDLSRQMLKAIASGDFNSVELLPEELRDRAFKIHKGYREKVGAATEEIKYRNLPYYFLIKDMYPHFNWVETGNQIQVETYFRGFKPNLLSYLLELIPKNEIASSARLARMGSEGININGIEQCQCVFRQEDVCPLSDTDIANLERWIAKGLSGAPLTIVSPVCPDYSATKGETRKYRFTFESVGTGVGLSCGRIFESLAALRRLFADLGLTNVTHHMYVGDFEAFNAENAKRVGLSTAAFVERNRGSCASIAATAPAPVITGLFTDLCGGRMGWEREYAGMRQRFEALEFGPIRGNPKYLEIAESRKALYRRWFDVDDSSDDFFESLVVSQGIEYATMGKIIGERFENPLILGADHYKMGQFYASAAPLPIIYLDRNYQ